MRAEIAAVPFGTLLQAKKKLAKTSVRRGADDNSDDDGEEAAGSRGEARKRQNQKQNKKRAADRASKHAYVDDPSQAPARPSGKHRAPHAQLLTPPRLPPPSLLAARWR